MRLTRETKTPGFPRGLRYGTPQHKGERASCHGNDEFVPRQANTALEAARARGNPRALAFPATRDYCTALIMSKIGRYIATTMPPTTTPRNTIMIGSRSDSSPLTAASTSSS